MIEKDTYLTEVVRYIHLNPYRARMCQVPEDYIWSSYREYLQKPLQYAADVKDVLSMYGNNTEAAKTAFVQHTYLGMDKDVKEWKREMYFDCALGSGEFVSKVKGLRDHKKPDKELLESKNVKVMMDEDKLKIILQQVNKVYNINERTLIGERGVKNPARRAVMYLIYKKTGLKTRQIADMFGGMHYSTVPKTIRRIENSEKEMKNIKRLLKTI